MEKVIREIAVIGLGVIVLVYVAGKYVYSHFIEEDDKPIRISKDDLEVSKRDVEEVINALRIVKEIKEKLK